MFSPLYRITPLNWSLNRLNHDLSLPSFIFTYPFCTINNPPHLFTLTQHNHIRLRISQRFSFPFLSSSECHSIILWDIKMKPAFAALLLVCLILCSSMFEISALGVGMFITSITTCITLLSYGLVVEISP